MSDATLLPARYDAMCRAIDAAYEVDEVKEIRDQSIAFEVYFKQAKNTEAERRACEIRLRAERKAGELLARREKAKAAPGNQYTGPVERRDGSKTLTDLGVTRDQSSRWQQLAKVPAEDFEAALRGEQKPSTAGIIATARPEPRRDAVDEDALWLWGRLLDFERRELLDRPLDEVCETMLPHMLETVRRLAPLVARWLGERDEGSGITTSLPDRRANI